jgi:hypothetical protein
MEIICPVIPSMNIFDHDARFTNPKILENEDKIDGPFACVFFKLSAFLDSRGACFLSAP